MTLPSIELNGVDPDGSTPPDELFYRPADGFEVSLCRQSRRNASPWKLTVYRNGENTDIVTLDDFEEAFSLFTSWIATFRPDAKGAPA